MRAYGTKGASNLEGVVQLAALEQAGGEHLAAQRAEVLQQLGRLHGSLADHPPTQ